MLQLIDSDIAIHWRDGNPEVIDRISRLDTLPGISVLTRAELEGGIFAKPTLLASRQRRWGRLVSSLQVLDVDGRVVDGYARIVAACGFSRPRIIDRLIAATAFVHGLTLVTINGPDFHDIPDLRLEVWPAPGQ